jgi:hypothetical protein
VVPWRGSSLFDEKLLLIFRLEYRPMRFESPRVPETLYRYVDRHVRQPGNRRMTPVGSEATIPAFARKT